MRRVLPIILVAVVLCGAFYVWRGRQRRAPLGPIGPVLTVTFLGTDLGGGMVVRTPDGACAVIDPGPESAGRDLAAYLADQEAGAVTVILTNPSPQRAGALKSLIESSEVRRVIRGEMETRSGSWTDAIEVARRQGIPELVLSAGDGVGLSKKVRLEVLSPPKGLIKGIEPDSPSNSLVTRIRFGNVKLLLASDAGVQTEGHLISGGAELASDVLAVGRHGEAGATSLELVSLVRPRYFVVSAGGMFGRPSRAVLSRIDTEHTGAEVYRTDRDGRIAVVTDGRNIAVETQGGGRE